MFIRQIFLRNGQNILFRSWWLNLVLKRKVVFPFNLNVTQCSPTTALVIIARKYNLTTVDFSPLFCWNQSKICLICCTAANHVFQQHARRCKHSEQHNSTPHTDSCFPNYLKPPDAQTSLLHRQCQWHLVWISELNTCKAEWFVKLEVSVWLQSLTTTNGKTLFQSKCLFVLQFRWNYYRLVFETQVCSCVFTSQTRGAWFPLVSALHMLHNLKKYPLGGTGEKLWETECFISFRAGNHSLNSIPPCAWAV